MNIFWAATTAYGHTCIHVVIVILLHGQAAVLGGATQATGFFKSFF